ncbi:type II secretion system minor pseudopilin GspH [Vibrio sp. LaRot3]|uniref:type II secretion system minor pseudopilin GspH n=1 Tax=Vibrio sp. LaRot3 TaxID=2998829 RepID=UPI0022CDC881|nr:type II secretion system minor pseudopilin GspH [Vibrio sp. LaRot3]MDA0149338.1 type II secretion system minor pseudopilin GspH [Vibrio sp. LaRot3]
MTKQKGFTLIELLLVVALLAVTVTAVVLSLPNNGRDIAEQEAKSLWFRVQLLNEEAMLSGRDFGLRIDDEKSRYTLLQLNEDGWQLLSMDRISAEAALDDSVAIELNLGGSVWQDQERLFEPSSLFDEQMFAEFEEEKKQAPPQVFITSSGEVTPFSIVIYPSNSDVEESGWQVVAKENGQVLLLAPGEQDEAK